MCTVLHPHPHTHTLPHSRSAHLALVDAQHQRSLDDVRQRLHLLVAEHRLEHGENTLGRVGCEGEDDLRRLLACDAMTGKLCFDQLTDDLLTDDLLTDAR